MIADETPLAGAGHNNPPYVRDVVATLAAEQKEALERYETRRDQIIASARAKTVFDRISAGDAADIIRIAGDVFKKIDEDRRGRTDPYRRAADGAKAVADEFWQPVVDELIMLRDRLKAWTDAEDARILAQKREQEEAMKALRAKAAPAPEPASERSVQENHARPATLPARRRKIVGDLGSTLSTVERTNYRVADIKLVPDWILATPTVHDAIIQVVRSMAKHAGEIPGIERTTFTENQIRGG
jgi:hypothetical protein